MQNLIYGENEKYDFAVIKTKKKKKICKYKILLIILCIEKKSIFSILNDLRKFW